MTDDWIVLDGEECPYCGAILEALATASDGGCRDGDSVRCPECGEGGCVSADEDGAEILWDSEE